MRRLLLVLLLGALGVWVGGDLLFVTAGAEEDQARPADVILVLGCSIYGGSPGDPSTCIQARADHAAAVYRRGLAPYVIASGGGAPGEATEAEALTGVLTAGGVPASAVLAEDESHDTIQNILNSERIMRAHGWRTVILVTEPYHIKRAGLIARDAGLIVYLSPAVESRIWHSPEARRDALLEDALSLMLYQVKAVLGIRN
jgi:uncharacterized SAM-binding protein YcdF (DUF218 family)